MKKILITVAFLSFTTFYSQTEKRPDNWFNLDPTLDKINGVSTNRTYEELLKNKPATPIIVGVLDSGVDYNHEDLKEVMWTNPGEIAGNGIDDDKNGYIDDIHGWNFIGGKDGQNVNGDNLEVTRLYRHFKPKYSGKQESDFTDKKEIEEFKKFKVVEKEYLKTKEEFESAYKQLSFLYNGLTDLNNKAKTQFNITEVTKDDISKFEAADKREKQFKQIALGLIGNDKNLDKTLENKITPGYEQFKQFMECGVNLEFDPRLTIVKDDYNNDTDFNYGNPDCKGPNSHHGTHVAGIIAAKRGNGIGMDGVANNVKIMAVRLVPGGDERDKDVAAGIRYATDNGAKILNMSFGKGFSWNKKIVDDAVKYAESKGVLLIHAAGNSHLDIDTEIHYPTKVFENGTTATSFIDVGALNWKPEKDIPATFTNYGKKTVDVFSPGVDIYSTIPENKYKDENGTSMAAPVVAGVAAVIKSYYPDLTAVQIKKIIIKSSNKAYKKTKVVKPGSKDELVKFTALGKNGGIVNLYEAIKLAQKISKVKS